MVLLAPGLRECDSVTRSQIIIDFPVSLSSSLLRLLLDLFSLRHVSSYQGGEASRRGGAHSVRSLATQQTFSRVILDPEHYEKSRGASEARRVEVLRAGLLTRFIVTLPPPPSFGARLGRLYIRQPAHFIEH